MTDIKRIKDTAAQELDSLRHEAIAVPLNNLILDYKMLNGELWVLNGNVPHKVQLPLGDWQLLGRADELKDKEIIQLMYGESYLFEETPIYEACDILWSEYCAKHKITNELILIKQ